MTEAFEPGRLMKMVTEAPPSALERAQSAVELRIAGKTWSRIAEELGYADASSAQHACKRLMPRDVPTREAMRAASVERLLEVGEAMRAEAVGKRSPSHARVLVQVEHTLASLLGLNAPTRVSVTEDAAEATSVPFGMYRTDDGRVVNASRWLAMGNDLSDEHQAASGFTPEQIESMRTEAVRLYGTES